MKIACLSAEQVTINLSMMVTSYNYAFKYKNNSMILNETEF